jgi:hypothetical protein
MGVRDESNERTVDNITLYVLYCTIVEDQKFIRGSCLILVFTTVIARLRRADAKTDVKNYQGRTTALENAIRKFPPYIF